MPSRLTRLRPAASTRAHLPTHSIVPRPPDSADEAQAEDSHRATVSLALILTPSPAGQDIPSPCCSLRHSVARPDGARSRALSPVRLCVLLPPFVRQGRHDLSRVRLALVRASMLRIDAARVTLTAGIARVTLAGARGICSCRHLSGAYSPPVPTRRAETSGSVTPCVPRERRVRPCISLAPCLCRPSVGDVGIVHVGAGAAALPALLARRPAASILRAPSRPNGSQCATGSGVRGSGGARPCRDIVRHPGGEIKTACAPPAAADGLDLSALLPSAADKGARAVNFSA